MLYGVKFTREIKKIIKKIDINKTKNVDTFIHQLNIIINNKKQLLKTLVIVKLNRIISDLKEKSKINDVYNYNDRDKLLMIYIMIQINI